MAKIYFLPPLMFLVLFAICGEILSANSPNISTDQSVLLVFKSHISHDPYNFLTTNWSTSTSVCNWIGVTCGSKHHRVTSLDLSGMGLTGTIPSELGNLSFLGWLDIRYNTFHGSLPTELTNLHRLKYWNFGNNRFDREIPSWFSYFAKLQVLWLYDNNFTGVIPSTLRQIPASICNLRSLMLLSLSNNNLDGTIPKCFGSLTSSLLHLDLGKNNCHGRMPENIAKSCSLQSFQINNNQLEGSLPRSLSNCKDLKLLDVGKNKLKDIFPIWLGNLVQLQVLILRSNRFYGHLDSFRVSVTHLHTIDLSYNNFSGYLPAKFFENLHAIKEVDGKKVESEYMKDDIGYYVQGVSLTIKGSEIEFESLLINWMVIDFSNNQFLGEIPKTVGELHSLIVLNLSHNGLTGPIPSSLGDLSELESLDLSSNKLRERIPMKLNNLGFLEVLNLSQNNLMGPIPQGKQFDTFTNESYSENLGLCGLPLSESCDNDKETPTKFDRDDEDDVLNWKFSILMGYGCGLVLGLSMGYIVFTIEKPWWFIKIFERVQHRFAKWYRRKLFR
ncbi:hypothetical protein V6N11_079159 [Hibiscus sabdariffa]|uniref:Leucine-rich repeat-containing N-terminal plant-type domain-containing protein n=1 Tax=Hibiscus sabdariffa TaxID=183260 RepID=A0ABR2RUX2_9ROSI